METKITIKEIDNRIQTSRAIQIMASTLGIAQEDAKLLIKGHMHGQVANIKIPVKNILSNMRRQLSKSGVNIQITIENEKA